MAKGTLQLTVRGIDKLTKQALLLQAKRRGTSLNSIVLESLQRSAGVTPETVRKQELLDALSGFSMTAADKKAFDEALAWMNTADYDKQQKDASHDPGI